MRLNPFSRKHYRFLIIYENGMKRWLRLDQITVTKVMGPLYFTRGALERFTLHDTIAPPSELDADFPERRLK